MYFLIDFENIGNEGLRESYQNYSAQRRTKAGQAGDRICQI